MKAAATLDELVVNFAELRKSVRVTFEKSGFLENCDTPCIINLVEIIRLLPESEWINSINYFVRGVMKSNDRMTEFHLEYLVWSTEQSLKDLSGFEEFKIKRAREIQETLALLSM